jgi:very-short-patch-repair endonuclease
MQRQHTCLTCGAAFTGHHDAPNKYCCRACLYQSMFRRERRVCPQCGAAFEARPCEPKRYCSPACAGAARGAAQRALRPERVCQHCGTRFLLKQLTAKGAYCSARCSNKANGLRRLRTEQRTCPYCGTTFLVSGVNRSKVCCSQVCAKRYAARTSVGPAHPLWKPKVRMTCEVCGAVRELKPSLAARFRVCSRACAAARSRMGNPRTSSLETRMAEAMRGLGLRPLPQAPFGPYNVDFAFPEARLVVECDGAYWHSLPKQKRIDHSKDAYLANRGWRVLRLTEAAIKASPATCAQAVLEAVMGRPRSPAE